MTSTVESELIVFGGKIRARDGTGVVGAKIEILSRKTRRVLASSISIEGGSYRIRVSRGSIDSRDRTLTIRALGGRGKLLVARSTPVLSNETVTDLVVPPDRLKNFQPAAQSLPRLTGPIMDPEALISLESAIRLIIPAGEAGHERLTHVIRSAVPPLARFDSVLRDSWEVLEGDLDAAKRLRRALTFLAKTPATDWTGPSAPLPPRGEGELGMRDFAYRAMPTTPLPDRDEIPFRPSICPLPTNRLVPIMAAALRIATDAEDAAVLLDGLDAGLRGMNSFEFLTKLGESALSSGNTAPLADELTRLTTEFGFDGDRLADDIERPFPPPGPPPPEPLEPCGRWTRECFGNLVEDWRLQTGIRELSLAPGYRITSLNPSDACPEQRVVISGNGFGAIPGQVVFPHRDGRSGIRVDPIPGTWSNTSVTAEVPAEAGSGTLRLLIQDGLYELVWTCEGPLAIYAQGHGIAFRGGATFVSSVTINGRATGAVVAPGSQFTVAWNASPASREVDVFVQETSTNQQIFLDYRPASGTITLSAPSLNSRGQIRAIVNALPLDGLPETCGLGHTRQALADIDVAPKLKIEGIEVTQGIQVFSLQGPRNTLSTVANKDTIVRVYVASDTGGTFRSPITPVTGVIRIDGIVLSPINGITPTRPGDGNPYITARAAADINRAQTDHTLNFRIPAALANNTKTLDIRVWGPGPISTRLFASASMAWQWQEIPPLTVRFVLMQDARGSSGPGAFPSESQARYTLQRALDLLPTPAVNIGPAWRAAHIVIDEDDAGNDIRDLNFIHTDLDPATGRQDKSGWIGLTLLPILPGMGMGSTVDLTSTSPIYINQDNQGPFRIVAAHEITHWLLGRCHTDDPRPACAGSTGPISVGEVIFDPYWNEAVGGTLSYFKVMPTGFDRHWIRPTDWNRLFATIIAWEGRP